MIAIAASSAWRALGEEASRALLGWLAGAFLAWFGWYATRTAWGIYTHTLIGERFVASHPSFHAHAKAFFALEAPWQVAFWASLEALIAAAAAAFLLRFLGLLGLFYFRLRWLMAPFWILAIASVLAEGFAVRHAIPEGGAWALLFLAGWAAVPTATGSARSIGPCLWSWISQAKEAIVEVLDSRWRDKP